MLAIVRVAATAKEWFVFTRAQTWARGGMGGDILPPWVQIPGDDNALAGGWEIRVENLH